MKGGRNHAPPVNGGMFCNDRGIGSLSKWMARFFFKCLDREMYFIIYVPDSSNFLLNVYCFYNTGVSS
jgi:hypothetical protein